MRRTSIGSVVVPSLIVLGLGMMVSPTRAEITVARTKNWTSRVTVEGKAANTEYRIWADKGDGNFVDYCAGQATVSTDESGDGTVVLSNSTGTSLFPTTGYENVKLGDENAVGEQAAKAISDETGVPYWPGNWWASLPAGNSGPHNIRLHQSVTADGTTLLETWDAGMTVRFRLDPTEAQWVNMGTAIVAHGDLAATVVSVTPSLLTVQVTADPTHSSSDDLEISGVGVNRIKHHSIPVRIEWMGSSSDYLDGVFLSTSTWGTFQSYVFGQSNAITPGIPPGGPFVLMGLLGLAGAYALVRTRLGRRGASGRA